MFNNRTICIPVAEIIEGGTKHEFYADLRRTLDLSRRMYNMALSECVSQDSDSYTVDGSIPTKAKIGTYSAIAKGKSFASGFTSEISNVLRSAESKYGDSRFDILRGTKSLPISRSQPWPLLCNKSNKRLSVEHQDGNTYATFRLSGGQWKVRLRSGSNYRDQIRGLTRDLSAIGDSKIWIDRRKHMAMIGFSVKVPVRVAIADPSKKLIVRSMPDCFLAMIRERSDIPYTFSGELILMRQSVKNGLLKRLRQDIKPRDKQKVRRKLASVSDAYQRWQDTYTHTVAKRIVDFAVSGKFGAIELDDAIRSFVPSFAWHDLKTKLAYKCDDVGIEFIHNPTIAFEKCETFLEPTPHIYFAIEIDRATGEPTGNVKIGKTTRPTHERLSSLGGQSNMAYEAIAVYRSKKSRLTKDEKMFHSLFDDHRITRDRELFATGPVSTWLRERGAIEVGESQPVPISRAKGDPAGTPNSGVRGNAIPKRDRSDVYVGGGRDLRKCVK